MLNKRAADEGLSFRTCTFMTGSWLTVEQTSGWSV